MNRLPGTQSGTEKSPGGGLVSSSLIMAAAVGRRQQKFGPRDVRHAIIHLEILRGQLVVRKEGRNTEDGRRDGMRKERRKGLTK